MGHGFRLFVDVDHVRAVLKADADNLDAHVPAADLGPRARRADGFRRRTAPLHRPSGYARARTTSRVENEHARMQPCVHFRVLRACAHAARARASVTMHNRMRIAHARVSPCA